MFIYIWEISSHFCLFLSGVCECEHMCLCVCLCVCVCVCVYCNVDLLFLGRDCGHFINNEVLHFATEHTDLVRNIVCNESRTYSAG